MIHTRYSFVATTSYLAILHSLRSASVVKEIHSAHASLLECGILISAFTLILLGLSLSILGLSLVQHSSRWYTHVLRRCMEAGIWTILIAVTSAIGKAGQDIVGSALGNSITGVLIAGAVGGLIIACGGGVIVAVGKLSALHLSLVGGTCVLIGFFAGFLQIMIMLLS